MRRQLNSSLLARSWSRLLAIAVAVLTISTASLVRVPLASGTDATLIALPNTVWTVLAVSDDERWVAYTDDASVDGITRVHRFDRSTGHDDVIAAAWNGRPAMTADGQEVLFSAWDDARLQNYGVYVWRASDGTLELLSPPGTQATYPSMSSDGRVVAWSGYDGTFAKDRVTGITHKLGGFQFSFTAMSGDGHVAVVSGYDSDGGSQAAAFDTATGAVRGRISDRQYQIQAVSDDGSYATGLGYGYVEQSGIYWLDFAGGTSRLMPQTYDARCNGDASLPFVSMSSDGQKIAFAAPAGAGDTVPNLGSSERGYFTYDVPSDAITKVSGGVVGSANSCPSVFMTPTGDGVYFTSDYSQPATALGLLGGNAYAADVAMNRLYRVGRAAPVVDSDQDGVTDSADNCVSTANSTQLDIDKDGIGDACDTQWFGFTTFKAPVDGGAIVNVMQAGAAVPVRFTLGGNFGLGVLEPGYPQARKVNCSASTIDVVEQTVTANQSGLTFDAAANGYQYNWKTAKAWAGTCQDLYLSSRDPKAVARFRFK